MKILLVDDSRAMRMIIKRAMRQAGQSNHTVVEASNGVEALDVLATESVDLILCDWNMPEMSGIELLEKLNEQGLRAIFGFVTSEGSIEKRKQAREAGASFLLTKPFNSEKLQQVFEFATAA